MPLLAPLFLIGLAAIAVPLLVHLVQREKRDAVAFPSLMFLERTKAPFTSRRNVRDPWLLLLRALAVAALALAFARPVLGRSPQVGGADLRRREVVVLLDRSFSMRIGQRWVGARAVVDSVIRTLAPGDRMTLVAFDRRAQAVTAATSDAAALRAGLASLAPTDESTRLSPAVALAQQRFAVSDAPRRALVVVSDFQRSGWDLTDESRLPAGTELAPIDVSGDSVVIDHAVRSVSVQRDRRPGTSQVIVSARVANVGTAARAVGVRLEVNGRTVEQRTMDLPRDGGGTVSFAAVPMPADAVPARVVLAPDAVSGDDAFNFVLQQAPVLPVVVIAARSSPFLQGAFAIGDLPRFDVVTRGPTAVTATDLVGRRLIVLADGAFPTGVGSDRLLKFVSDGGGLIVALGDQSSQGAWPAAARALIPGRILAASDRSGGSGAVLGAIDQQHPALALLSGARTGDLTAARFYKFRAIDTTAGVLARFDDGSPALTEHAVGRGRVITFGSSLDGVWNDLPRQPAFLPLMQQLARYAAAWRDLPGALEIGASVRPGDLVGVATGPSSSRWVATAPSGARTAIGGDGTPAALALEEAGVHELRPGGSPGARPLLVAANIAPAELDFASFDVARLTNALTSTSSARSGSVAAEQETLSDREARQSTWWYLLLAAALLLIAESAVARRAMTRTLAQE